MKVCVSLLLTVQTALPPTEAGTASNACNDTTEISQRSRRIQSAHQASFRHLIENDGLLESPRFVLPDTTGVGEKAEPEGPKMPKFVEVPKEEYDDFKKSVRALTKLLKPESVDTLKRLTSAILSDSKREADVRTYGVPPEKLPTAAALPLPSSDSEGQLRAGGSWVQQFSEIAAVPRLQQTTPFSQQYQLQQPHAGISQVLTPSETLPFYYNSNPTLQDPSFRPLSIPGNQPTSYLPLTPQWAYPLDPPVEFYSPLQLPVTD